jgi:hypothetical protein
MLADRHENLQFNGKMFLIQFATSPSVQGECEVCLCKLLILLLPVDDTGL